MMMEMIVMTTMITIPTLAFVLHSIFFMQVPSSTVPAFVPVDRPLLVHFSVRTPSSTMHVRTDFRSYYFTLQHLQHKKNLQVQFKIHVVLNFAIKIVVSSLN